MRTTRLVPALLAALMAALLSALALSPTASAVEPRPGDGGPQPIIGGGYAQNAPWAARLFSGRRQTCTSTIISPTWILTAKHCVSGGNLAFRIGSLDQGSGGTVANGVQTVTSPSADLALVRLDRSVSATYARLGQPGT
ncbi:trypsin-like serine protease, partial [Streptomyces violaceoruber]